MAAYIGKIEAFDETIEPWSSYVERPFTTNYILILTKYNYKHMMRKTV
jgi:hypothetical protein